MKFRYIFVFAFFFIYNNSFSCECKPIDRENMVEIGLKYEIAFYGEVIKVDSIKRIYTFKIIELFKGKYNSRFITQKYLGNCSVTPSIKQLWIVYANFNEDKTIEVSSCSPSTGFKPYGSNSIPSPPETKISQKTDEQIRTLSFYAWDLKFENRNLQDWIYQLEKLRLYKKAQKDISDKEKTEEKLETYSRYIIISLIVNIVLFLTLIFEIYKKKIFSK
ncbi:hypothetical protein HNP37_002490 [Flavobacterium nitrogenifigens]|uniref:Tissue inhibitor of metalloproteinase n=2 Tax=Flavobacterium TaxID=237 RepID=A0A7W7IXQ8_9FLAO|nr:MULTISPECIES: hypothetical protein [Flavobacterium]MBB4802417.1 hypothetical protein [Flavobacterium nitrogenifigens]MBB6387375.1 hypothetical protein [Flavobacterium notoginsengisoli]